MNLQSSPEIIGATLASGMYIKRSWSSKARVAFRAIFKVRGALWGSIWVAVMISFAIFAPWLSPADPNVQDLDHLFASPSFQHPMGTDYLGRDLLSRMIYGCRIAMMVAFGAATLATIFGVILGVTAGYSEGGKIDYALILIFDVVRAFPQIILAIAIIAVLGPSILNLILALAFTGFPFYGRLTRAQAMVVKESDYVKAAVSMGLKHHKIILQHIIPNILIPVIVCLGMDLPWYIIYEAGLSFLGLGVRPPTASWGIMLRDGYTYIDTSPWMILWPALAIASAMLAFSFFSQGIKAALDPKKRER